MSRNAEKLKKKWICGQTDSSVTSSDGDLCTATDSGGESAAPSEQVECKPPAATQCYPATTTVFLRKEPAHANKMDQCYTQGWVKTRMENFDRLMKPFQEMACYYNGEYDPCRAVKVRETMADTLAELAFWKMRAKTSELEHNDLKKKYNDCKKSLQDSICQPKGGYLIYGKSKTCNKVINNDTQEYRTSTVQHINMPDALCTKETRKCVKPSKTYKSTKSYVLKRLNSKKRKENKPTDCSSSEDDYYDARKTRVKIGVQVKRSKHVAQKQAVPKTTQFTLPPVCNYRRGTSRS